jgi:hypothetical protein
MFRVFLYLGFRVQGKIGATTNNRKTRARIIQTRERERERERERVPTNGAIVTHTHTHTELERKRDSFPSRRVTTKNSSKHV